METQRGSFNDELVSKAAEDVVERGVNSGSKSSGRGEGEGRSVG